MFSSTYTSDDVSGIGYDWRFLWQLRERELHYADVVIFRFVELTLGFDQLLLARNPAVSIRLDL
jgi:hypothetical protein